MMFSHTDKWSKSPEYWNKKPILRMIFSRARSVMRQTPSKKNSG